MRGGAQVPARDPATLLELDRDELTRAGQERLVAAVQIDVATDAARRRAADGAILRRDQSTEGRTPKVGQVDPAEQPVPVAVVRLPGEEVVEGERAVRSGRQRIDEVARREHLLVDVVD